MMSWQTHHPRIKRGREDPSRVLSTAKHNRIGVKTLKLALE